MRRLAFLLLGASLGAVGWGAALPVRRRRAVARIRRGDRCPHLHRVRARARSWHPRSRGLLADRAPAVTVATVARLGMVLLTVALMFARDASSLWTAAFGYGAALAVLQPSISVLVLGPHTHPPPSRRVRLAVHRDEPRAGAGRLRRWLPRRPVDVDRPRPAYLFAALCSLVSAVVVYAVGRSVRRGPVAADEPSEDVGYRAVLRAPGVRWMLAVTGLLTLACYAQFDSGLPSYALTVLDVPPTTLGTAVAVNAVLVAALTAPVVRATRRSAPADFARDLRRPLDRRLAGTRGTVARPLAGLGVRARRLRTVQRRRDHARAGAHPARRRAGPGRRHRPHPRRDERRPDRRHRRRPGRRRGCCSASGCRSGSSRCRCCAVVLQSSERVRCETRQRAKLRPVVQASLTVE